MQRHITHNSNGTAANEQDQQQARRDPVKPARNELLMTNEAADFLRLSARTLERMRVEGTGPRFLKAGPGLRARVLYRQTDLEDWLASYSFASTSEYDGG